MLLPADPGYPSVLKWFIGRYDDLMPAIVVRCASVDDVVAALAFAREHELEFAVRSGAHSFAEHSSTTGLLIDVGQLRSVSVEGDLVTVGPGVRLGPIVDELATIGRTLPLGWCPFVGVAGAALGGGFGPLARYYGLAVDQLVAAQIVLADGRVLTVDAANEPDLFWALRGAGGGHFGVVTQLVLRTSPAAPLTSFAAWWPADQAVELVDAWQQFAPFAPAELNCMLVLHTAPPDGEHLAVVFGLLVGDEDGDRVRSVLDELATRVGSPPERTLIEPMAGGDTTYQYRFNGEVTEHEELGGRPVDQDPAVRFVKSEFFEQLLPREAIEALVANWSTSEPDQRREIECVPWGRAIGRVPAEATAFVHRDALFMIETTIQSYGEPDRKRAAFDWATTSKAALHPWGNGHVYQNYPDPELVDASHAYYGSNLDRLLEVKAKYDPDNFFTSSQPLRR
jgi:hypothetical protein